MSAVEIAGRTVGDGAPVLVIAEVGVNHDGEREQALALIDAAAEAGADAVKFQTFKADALVTEDAPLAEYQRRSQAQSGQAEMLRRLELGEDDFAALAAHARERGLLFLSTPFDEASAAVLDRIGVPAIKTGSGELTNLPFLAALAARGLPMIVSTGMATLEEVRAAVEAIRAAGDPPLALLHCVSSYPAPAEQANLRAIGTLAGAFGLPTGWSHHCLEDEVALAAVAHGACMVEAHLTLDRALPGPDHAMSMEPGAFGALVRGIRLVEAALGDGRKVPQPVERDVAAVARRSVVTARALRAGEPLALADLTTKRPSGGLDPARIPGLVGRRLARDVPADRQLAEADLEPADAAAADRATAIRVAVLTGGRADYGLLRPTIQALAADERFEPLVIAAAMHLDPLYGDTLAELAADGVPVAGRVPTPHDPALPGEYAQRLAAGLRGATAAFAALEPDVLLVLGDRHEALSAALAATALSIPIAHLHGGELSEGSLDDAMRHCITKLAHVHLPATRDYAERIVQLGEDPRHVHVVGAAGIEGIRTLEPLSREQLAAELGLERLGTPLLTVTFHPASLDAGAAGAQAREVAGAIEDALGDGTAIVTLPNDDPGQQDVRAALLELAERHPGVHAHQSLGQRRYLALLAHADAVVGNSSSGIIEAPSFRLPTVNVGDRQRGRTRAGSIIDVPPERAAVAQAIGRAVDPAFRASLEGMQSPYGDGHVAEKVLEILAATPLDTLRAKRFHDLPDGPWRQALAEVAR